MKKIKHKEHYPGIYRVDCPFCADPIRFEPTATEWTLRDDSTSFFRTVCDECKEEVIVYADGEGDYYGAIKPVRKAAPKSSN